MENIKKTQLKELKQMLFRFNEQIVLDLINDLLRNIFFFFLKKIERRLKMNETNKLSIFVFYLFVNF
jgi:hypothetical protein